LSFTTDSSCRDQNTIMRSDQALIVGVLCGLLALPAAPARGGDQLDADLELFLAWFPGEYDNHEQVWQKNLDGVDHPHEHIHHIFAPAEVRSIGENVFYVQQYLDADPSKVYRQRLYRLSVDEGEHAIRLDIFLSVTRPGTATRT